MQWTYGAFAIPLGVSGVAALSVAVRVWRRQYTPGRNALVMLGAVSAIWCFGNLVELGLPDLRGKLLWANIEYIGIAWAPMLWLVFALQYTSAGRKPVPLGLAALCVIPVITTLLVWTNDYHGLIRQNVALDSSGPWLIVTKTYGPWFWVHIVQTYAWTVGGALIMWRGVARQPRQFHTQTGLLTVAMALPLLGNIAYLALPRTLLRLDLTPIAFAFSSAMISVAIGRYGLLDLLPAARSAIVDVLSDGLVVIDAKGRVVDMNPSAERILAVSLGTVFGKTIAHVLGRAHSLAVGPERMESTHTEVELGNAEAPRYYDLATTPLSDRRGRPLGTAYSLHDITERKESEMERERLIAELQSAVAEVRTLSGLLPICSSCKRIRDDAGYWRQVEEYLTLNSGAQFTHGICPDCLARIYPDLEPDESAEPATDRGGTTN